MKGSKDVAPDIPDNIKRFRLIINGIKRGILEKTEQYSNTADIQDKKNLDGIAHRIRQLGLIINMILDNIDHSATTSIINHFKKHSFDFSKLSDEDRELCKHYVTNDIFKYHYDLNPGHINSIPKLGDV